MVVFMLNVLRSLEDMYDGVQLSNLIDERLQVS